MQREVCVVYRVEHGTARNKHGKIPALYAGPYGGWDDPHNNEILKVHDCYGPRTPPPWEDSLTHLDHSEACALPTHQAVLDWFEPSAREWLAEKGFVVRAYLCTVRKGKIQCAIDTRQPVRCLGTSYDLDVDPLPRQLTLPHTEPVSLGATG